ncbi:MAG TPA: hypothetical protein VFD35_14145 [Pricia sp.]|nr:hypothetical protein [Pricia sp.]
MESFGFYQALTHPFPDPSVYIRMLARFQAFSYTLLGEDMEKMEKVLDKSNAFLDNGESVLKIIGY